MTDYTELVKALRCKSLSKECDSCGYGYRLCPDSECNDACHVEKVYADAAAAIEEMQQIADHYEQTAKDYWKEACEYKAQLPKRGEWKTTDAFPHRVYCSNCFRTYVPNNRWQIWVDKPGEGGLERNYCPSCGAKMEVRE